MHPGKTHQLHLAFGRYVAPASSVRWPDRDSCAGPKCRATTALPAARNCRISSARACIDGYWRHQRDAQLRSYGPHGVHQSGDALVWRRMEFCWTAPLERKTTSDSPCLMVPLSKLCGEVPKTNHASATDRAVWTQARLQCGCPRANTRACMPGHSRSAGNSSPPARGRGGRH